MAKREKDQSDFDLERVFDLFDSALTSKDERVVNALRNLLMITALTAPEVDTPKEDMLVDRRTGPLRRMADDISNMARRMQDLEYQIQALNNKTNNASRGYGPTPLPPYTISAPVFTSPISVGPYYTNNTSAGLLPLGAISAISATDMSEDDEDDEIEKLIQTLKKEAL